MEYLMTYGWAILIIAVVLGTLYQMGVFNSSSLTVRVPPGACKVLRTSVAVNLVGQCSGLLPKYTGQFDGQSSYVSVPDNPNIDAIYGVSETFTLEAWVYPTVWMNYMGIINKRTDGWYSASPGGIFADTSGLDFIIGTGNEAESTSELSFMPTLNTWHQIVGTAQRTDLTHVTMTLYVDGVSRGSTVTTLNPPTNNNPMTIGAFYAGLRSFGGFISDVQVYNISLDSSQVQSLYLKGIGGAPVDPNHIVGWWPLNGDVNDYSGNNNNGVPTALTFTTQYGK